MCHLMTHVLYCGTREDDVHWALMCPGTEDKRRRMFLKLEGSISHLPLEWSELGNPLTRNSVLMIGGVINGHSWNLLKTKTTDPAQVCKLLSKKGRERLNSLWKERCMNANR